MIVCLNYDPGLTMIYFTARSNFVILAFRLEKVKKVDFTETIAACYFKLIDLFKNFLTLTQCHLHMKSQLAFLRNHWPIFNHF